MDPLTKRSNKRSAKGSITILGAFLFRRRRWKSPLVGVAFEDREGADRFGVRQIVDVTSQAWVLVQGPRRKKQIIKFVIEGASR